MVRPPARLLAAGVFALALAGCRSGPSAPVRLEVPDSFARTAYGRATRLRLRGDEEGALRTFQEAVARAPFFVEAHRAIQEIRAGRLEKGALLIEYRRLLEENPRRPEAHYLYGRLLATPQAQRERFEEALRLAPSFAYAWNGIAVVERLQGDPRAARRAYERAIELDRTRPDFLLGLGEVFLSEGRLDAAGETARRGIRTFPADGRFHLLATVVAMEMGNGREALEAALEGWRRLPEEAPALRTLQRAVERFGTGADLRRVRGALLEESERTPRLSSREAEREVLLSWIDRRLGDPLASLGRIERAVRRGLPPFRVREERIELLVACGMAAEVARVVGEDVPTGLLEDPPNGLAGRWRSLREAAAAASDSPEDPAVLESFAGALRDAGFPAAAKIAAERSRLRGSSSAGAIVDACESYPRFVEALHEALSAPQPGTLLEVLGRIGEISVRILGTDITRGSRLSIYFPVGAIVDPTSGALGLPAWFERWNRFALLGRRAGGRVEGIVLRTLSRRPVSTSILGRPIEGEAVVGERREISPSFAAGGTDIAGAAVFDGYFLDLDVVRGRAAEIEEILSRHAPNRDRILADPLPPATTEEEVLSVAEPLALEEKLLLLAAEGEPPRWVDRVLATVELHERAHLADAREFLPLLARLPRVLPVLVRTVVRGTGFEAALEERAELAALAASEDPRVALAGVLATVRTGAGGEPHRSAYRSLLGRLVRRLWRTGEEYAAVRPDQNLLQQLFRLEEAQLSRLFQDVAREEGLLAASPPPPLSSRARGG